MCRVLERNRRLMLMKVMRDWISPAMNMTMRTLEYFLLNSQKMVKKLLLGTMKDQYMFMTLQQIKCQSASVLILYGTI